jgi:hypothetical protein
MHLEEKIKIRIDYNSQRYSENPDDRPDKLSKLLLEAGLDNYITKDRNGNDGPEGEDTIVITGDAAQSAGDLFKVICGSHSFVRFRVNCGVRSTGIRDTGVLIRLG